MCTCACQEKIERLCEATTGHKLEIKGDTWGYDIGDVRCDYECFQCSICGYEKTVETQTPIPPSKKKSRKRKW